MGFSISAKSSTAYIGIFVVLVHNIFVGVATVMNENVANGFFLRRITNKWPRATFGNPVDRNVPRKLSYSVQMAWTYFITEQIRACVISLGP